MKKHKKKSIFVFSNILFYNKIYITFNIGYFRTGKRVGEIHDRGTAFRISTDNIGELFTLIDKV